MKKTVWIYKTLYLMLIIYGILLSWFAYVGPYLSWKVSNQLKSKNVRVVVSLTTTPYRIDKIQPILDSILAQSIKPDRIYMNIPEHFKRDNLAYVIPSWLQQYEGIVILRTEDYGPITKLLPALAMERDPETIIITIDDDVRYPRHVVRDLVHVAIKNPRFALTPINLNFDLGPGFMLRNIRYRFKNGSKVGLIVGAGGVAYRRNFFKDDFVNDVTSFPKECRLADDLVISMYLAHNNVGIMQTTEGSLNPIVVPFTYQEMSYKGTPDALSFARGPVSGNQLNYAACLSSLIDGPYAVYVQSMIKYGFYHDK